MSDERLDKILEPLIDRLRLTAIEFAESLPDLKQQLDELTPSPTERHDDE